MAAVAVVGYGTVGSGVVEIIETHREMLLKKTGKRGRVYCINDTCGYKRMLKGTSAK